MKYVIYGNETTNASQIEVFNAKESYSSTKQIYKNIPKYLTKSKQGGVDTPQNRLLEFVHIDETITLTGYITAASWVTPGTKTYAHEVRNAIFGYMRLGGPCGLKITNNAADVDITDWNTTKEAYILKCDIEPIGEDKDIPDTYQIIIQFYKAIQR